MKVNFFIHDLNPWGGQDRSTLEVINRLESSWILKVYCYSIHGLKRPETRVRILKPSIKRLFFLKAGYYYLATLFITGNARLRGELVHATGTCALFANKIQVQFVHHAWSEVMAAHPELKPTGNFLKSVYHRGLLSCNLLLEKLLYRRGKDYLAISNRVKEELIRFFSIPPERISVIPHGVDSDFFHPGSEIEKNALKKNFFGAGNSQLISKKIILLVGEYQRKGLESSIRAFSRVPLELRRDWILMAVGGGDENYFRRLAQSFHLEESLVLAGQHQNILPFYQMSDLFLLPTHYEPFGLVIFEAMACGLPSLVSRTAGAYELAEEGESICGITDPSDVNEIATSLSRLLSDASVRLKLGATGREVAEKRSWDQVATEHQEWLRS